MMYKHLRGDRAIRGIAIGEDAVLTAEVTRDIATAFAAFLKERYPAKELRIAVGRDRRDSSPALAEAVAEGLVRYGVQVLDCGVATPDAVSFATKYDQSDCDGAIEVTAAHLPPQYNGLRCFTREGEIVQEDVEWILQRAQDVTSAPKNGTVTAFDIMTPHADEVCAAIRRGIGKDPTEIREIRIPIAGGNFRAYGREVLADFEQYVEQLSDAGIEEFPYEGVRVRFKISLPRSWMLMRLSPHDPELCIHMESYVQGGCDVMSSYQDRFLKNYDRLSV